MSDDLLQGIQRYNQGFGKFGPLEKCKDGWLVKAEDALTLAKRSKVSQDLYREIAVDVEGQRIFWKTIAISQFVTLNLFWVVRIVMANL